MATVEVMLNLAGVSAIGGGVEGEAAGASAGGKTKEAGEQEKTQKGILRKIGGAAKGITGIQFTGAAMLKQSQIFTSTVGVIFQLLGALVDVILAPLMPIIIPVISLLAKSIPLVSKAMNWLVGAIGNAISWVKDLLDDPVKTIVASFGYFAENVVGWVKEALEFFFGGGKVGFLALTFAKLWAYIPDLPIRLLKLAKGLLGAGGRMIMTILKYTATPVWAFFKLIGNIASGIFNRIKLFWRFIRRALDLQKIFTALKNTLSNFMGGIWEKLGKVIGKVPMMGKVGKAISGIAKASKGIPVLGAVATAGFGAYETYNAYKKTGSWKVAGAYALKTAAATTATAFGASAIGMGIDVGGSMALNKHFGGSYMTLKVEQDTGDMTTKSQEIRFVSERDLAQSEGMKVVLD